MGIFDEKWLHKTNYNEVYPGGGRKASHNNF